MNPLTLVLLVLLAYAFVAMIVSEEHRNKHLKLFLETIVAIILVLVVEKAFDKLE